MDKEISLGLPNDYSQIFLYRIILGEPELKAARQAHNVGILIVLGEIDLKICL